MDRPSRDAPLVLDLAPTWQDFVEGLRQSNRVREALTQQLIHCPHEAVCWETVPTSAARLGDPFRFETVPVPALIRSPDPSPFGTNLAPDGVSTFKNLGGDAVLVVPPPTTAMLPHGAHLLDWLRHAPDDQIHTLWQAVGDACALWFSTNPNPLWLSTAGMGVPWVHIRRDSRPKYYRTEAFRHLG